MATAKRTEESSGGVILQSDLLLLVHQTTTNTWAFPKGHLEPYETPLQAAIREIREETGLVDLQLLEDLGSYKRPSKRDPHIVKDIYMYLFRTHTAQLLSGSPDVDRCQWLSLATAEQRLSYPQDRAFLQRSLPTLHSHLDASLRECLRS